MTTVASRLNAYLEITKAANLNATASAINFMVGELEIQSRRLEVANWRIDALVLELEAVRGADVEIPIDGGELNSPGAGPSDQ